MARKNPGPVVRSGVRPTLTYYGAGNEVRSRARCPITHRGISSSNCRRASRRASSVGLSVSRTGPVLSAPCALAQSGREKRSISLGPLYGCGAGCGIWRRRAASLWIRGSTPVRSMKVSRPISCGLGLCFRRQRAGRVEVVELQRHIGARLFRPALLQVRDGTDVSASSRCERGQ